MTTAKQFLEQHKDQLIGPGPSRFELTSAMKEIIDLVVQERLTGKRYSMLGLFRVMENEFEIPVSYEAFRRRVVEYTEGRW